MPVHPLRSLRIRLIASVVLIEVVMLTLLVLSNLGVIRTAHAERLRNTAESMLQQIAMTSGRYLIEVDYATLEEYLENIARHQELTYLAVLNQDRRPVTRLGDLPGTLWPARDADPLQVGDGVFDVDAPITIGGRPIGNVHMGFSLANMERAIQAARIRSITIAIAEIIMTIIVTVFIGMHLTRRLGHLANAAQRVGAGDYSVAVEAEVRDEVGMTADAFNHMVAEISERTRRLDQTRARERVIEETAIDGMVTYDAAGTILSLNPAMTALFGYTEQELLGHCVTGLLAHPDDEPAETGTGIPWNQPTATRTEASGQRKDGSRFPLELHIGSVAIDGEPLFAATLHDITDRKRAESECKTLLAGNRFLIHKSLAVQEEERRYLARELHDELGQCMTAIQADAEIIHDLSRTGNPKIRTSAVAILDVSTRIYDVVHSMMQRLRPSVLDDLGLVAAIEEEIEAWQQRYKSVDLELTIAGDVAHLGEAVNISIYRIIQESLTNISKHAEATRIRVRLERQMSGDRGRLRLSIADNGTGMTPGEPPGRGLGLIGMRERVEALNGSFSVDSARGQGLRIEVAIPLGSDMAA